MKKFDSKKFLQNIGILLAMEIGMVAVPLTMYLSNPLCDGFGLILACVFSALGVSFLFGVTTLKIKIKLLITLIAATIYDILFVLWFGSDMETLSIYFLVFCLHSLVGVSSGSLIKFVVKAIKKKTQKSASVSEKEEG